MPKKMTDVEKSIYEVSSEINHAKQIAKQRSSELKDVYLEEEQLSTENW